MAVFTLDSPACTSTGVVPWPAIPAESEQEAVLALRIGRVAGQSASGVQTRAFLRRGQMDFGPPLSVDVDASIFSPLEAAVAALTGEVTAALAQALTRRRFLVDAVETRVEGVLDNPLACLRVVGVRTTPPRLGRVRLRIRVDTSASLDECTLALSTALAICPLYQTLGAAVPIRIQLEPVG